ncbi:MAG TPA: hypothetical protein VHE37_05370 [Nevskiaceae bacterium]|nr:hypothetical protein [Nevskiaceae bacterium]
MRVPKLLLALAAAAALSGCVVAPYDGYYGNGGYYGSPGYGYPVYGGAYPSSSFVFSYHDDHRYHGPGYAPPPYYGHGYHDHDHDGGWWHH